MHGGGWCALSQTPTSLPASTEPVWHCLQEGSKILFVPGPNDPGPASVLPRPPLPTYFTEKLAEEIPGVWLLSHGRHTVLLLPGSGPHNTATT